MANKIRGYRWSFNYRGFDVYCKTGPISWKVVPSQNLINKDLATVEHTLTTNDGQYVFSWVDDHFEVLETMTGEDLQGSAVTEDRPDKHYQRDYEACSE